jgi:TPP-dependent 2-oxoacid decarboxylase
MDMVSEEVDASRLDKPLDLTPPSDPAVEDEVVTLILDAVSKAQNPMILADLLTSRFRCTPEVRRLVDITMFPVRFFLTTLTAVLLDQHCKGCLE